MSSLRPIALFALTLTTALSANAAQAQQPSNDVCNRACADLQFMQQLATTDGNTNPYIQVPAPAACKSADQATKDSTARKPQTGEKELASSPADLRRYN